MKKRIVVATVLTLALASSQLAFAADATTSATSGASAAAAATPAPAKATPKPAAATPKPAAATPKPAAATPKPAAATPKPAAATPKPAAATPAPTPAPVATAAPVAKPVDAVTAPSAKESSDPSKVIAGLGEKGTWIFSILSNVTLESDVTVSGTFYDKDDKEAGKVYRKLALYAQDENHKVTANYTLTVPKLTVTSPNFRIQNGTVKGDIYVNAVGFELNGTKVLGNVYFATQSYYDTATITKATVTGDLKVKGFVDGLASASPKEGLVPDGLHQGMSEKGYWIYSITNNMKLDKALDVDGTFYSKGDDKNAVYRKLALYSQDANHVITKRYTLTVPEIHVTSPNFRISKGTVVGDVCVHSTAAGFNLDDATIDGNVYFATQAVMDNADLTKGKVTGKVELKEIDAVATVSVKEGADPEKLAKALSAEGYWIYSITNNVTTDKDIVVDGKFFRSDIKTGTPAPNPFRKLALYTQDSKRTTTNKFTLTFPTMTVNSSNFSVQKGYLVGDVYVNAPGFELNDTVLTGNVYFSHQSFMDTAKLSTAGSVVSGGAVEVKPIDGVSSSSVKESKNGKDLIKGLSSGGTWIFSITSDVTVNETINADGVFYDKGAATGAAPYRKLALYYHPPGDSGKTADFTLTAPKMVVTSPNFRINYGTFKGNVYVDADGFNLANSTIQGNLIFKTWEQRNAFVLGTGKVTGTISVQTIW